jgi:hypothetical protein
MEQYHYSNAKEAEHYYAQAEQAADALELKDPNVANTLGYFYYQEAREEQDPAKRRALIDAARGHLQRALAIDPNFRKSLLTLQGVDQLDNATKVKTATKPAA